MSVERWLVQLQLQGRSGRTVEGYAGALRRLAAWCAPRTPEGLAAADLERYLAERLRAGLGPSAIGVAISAMRSFYRYVGSPAAAGLRMPRVKPRLQRTLDYAEAEQLVASIDTSTLEGKRDLALIALVIASGLRASEVARLKLADLDLEAGTFAVIVKGGQMEIGVFDEDAGATLASWLAVRGLAARPETPTVFVSLARGKQARGRPLTSQGVKLLCKRLAQRAGLKHFSPHALRRYFATNATENGCPSRLLMSAGRWKNLTQLEQYARATRLKAFLPYSPFARLMGGGQKPGEKTGPA